MSRWRYDCEWILPCRFLQVWTLVKHVELGVWPCTPELQQLLVWWRHIEICHAIMATPLGLLGGIFRRKHHQLLKAFLTTFEVDVIAARALMIIHIVWKSSVLQSAALLLNASKTKDMIVDSRKKRRWRHIPLSILVEQVNNFGSRESASQRTCHGHDTSPPWWRRFRNNCIS